MRVLLADDDPHVRSALRLLLENEPGVSIVDECATGSSLVEHVVCSGADVVLLDWDLPGRPAGDLERLRRVCPQCYVIALSGRPEHRLEALRDGVDFISKGDAPEGLLGLLRALKGSESNGQTSDEPEKHIGRPEVLEVVEQRVREPGAEATGET